MKVCHRIDLGYEKTTLGVLLDAQVRFGIPNEAHVFESDEDYSIIIEWEDDDE